MSETKQVMVIGSAIGVAAAVSAAAAAHARGDSVIKPTIGRRLWYWPARFEKDFHYSDASQPCDAGIAYVHSDQMINVSVADQAGVIHSRTSVLLVQEGEARPQQTAYCEWMPYQVGQAKKGGV